MSRLKKALVGSESFAVGSPLLPPGADIIPSKAFVWRSVLPILHRLSQTFGYERIEPSPVELLDSFSVHAAGVEVERLVKLDPGSHKKSVLRPENFLSVLRAYTANRLYEHERVTKWYYIEPAFSADKNQLLHTYEYGLVNFGEPTAVSEAHLLLLLRHLAEAFGASLALFEINCKGCENCAPYYEEVLSAFLHDNRDALCVSCQQLVNQHERSLKSPEKLYQILSCGSDACQPVAEAAPQSIDHLDPACNRQLTALLENLDELDISYQLNPRLFGGPAFAPIVFRLKSLPPAEGGEEFDLGVGGRQNRFVSNLAGQSIPTLVFSAPLTVFITLTQQQASRQQERLADVFLINLGEMAVKKSLRLFRDLLSSGIAVAEHFGENGIRNQFKLAEKNGCTIALLIGQKEALDGTVILREVRSGIQEVFAYDRIIEEVRKRLQD